MPRNAPDPPSTAQSARPLPTVADIARAAGVGTSTVSRALNERGEIKSSTRARIKQVARELGYVAQPALASLVSRRKTRKPAGRNEAGFLPVAIVTRQSPATTADRFFKLFNKLGNPLGYRYEHFNTLDGKLESAAQLGRMLFARGFVGVVFVHVIHDPGWFQGFPWERFALVSLDPSFDLVPLPMVRASDFEDVWQCWHHLRERGFERIGAILPEGNRERIEDIRRLGAYYQCQAEVPPTVRIPPLSFAYNESGLIGRICQWIEQERPDALLSWSASYLEEASVNLGWLPESVVILRGGGSFAGMEQGNRVYEEIVRIIDQLVRSACYGPSRYNVEHVVRSQWLEAGTRNIQKSHPSVFVALP